MPPSFVGMVKKAIFPVRLSSECNTPERVFYLTRQCENQRKIEVLYNLSIFLKSLLKTLVFASGGLF